MSRVSGDDGVEELTVQIFSSRTANKSNSRHASSPRMACWCLAAIWKSNCICLFVRGWCTGAVNTPVVCRAVSSNMHRVVVAGRSWAEEPSTKDAGSRLTVEPQSSKNLTVRPSTTSFKNNRLRSPATSDNNLSSESSDYN